MQSLTIKLNIVLTFAVMLWRSNMYLLLFSNAIYTDITQECFLCQANA